MVKQIAGYVNSFFSKGHERSLQAKKNIIYSLILKGGSILISLILVPITITFVNPTQYGVWLTLSSIISWFTFFDIGLGNGLKNKLAESLAINDIHRAKIYVSTTYTILIIVSVLIFIIFYISNLFLDWNAILNINDKANLSKTALTIVSVFCIQFVFQLINVVLTACQEPAKVSLLTFIGQVLSLSTILLLSHFYKGTLLLLVITIAGAPLLVTIISNFWFYLTNYRHIRPSIKDIDFLHAKSLLSIGGAFFVIQMGQLILYQTDNIVITQLFGPKEVTTFNLSYKLFSVVLTVFTIVMTPFWSAFTDAYAKGDHLWIHNTFKNIQLGWLALVIGTALLVVVSPIIFKLWIKEIISIPLKLSVFMGLYVIISSFHMMCCFLLNGIGKIKLQLYMYMVCFVINIPISIILGKWLGVIGITLSNIILLAIMGIMLYVQCQKILNSKAVGIWNK